MGSKSNRVDTVNFQRKDGQTQAIQRGVYNNAVALGENIKTADISSLDRQELLDQLNQGLEDNVNTGKSDTIQGQFGSYNQQLEDAKAGTKPKYRYRKYLDATVALQNDQPGQLQTILSQSGPFSKGASILGGGSL